jgi:HEAT repeat protein
MLPLLIAVAGWLTVSSPEVTADEDATSRWIVSLRDPAKRQETAYAFDDVIGEGHRTLLPLLQAIKDSDPFVRRAAAAALGEIAVKPDEIIQPLIEALSDKEYDVNRQAAVALAKIGTPAVPALAKVLATYMRAGRHRAATMVICDSAPSGPWFLAAVALADIGTPSVGALVQTLRIPPRADLGFTTYQVSLMALGRIGPPAISQLAQSQSSPDHRFRILTAIALARVRADLKSSGMPTTEIDDVAPAVAVNLAEAVRSNSSTGKWMAIRALGRIGPPGVPALVSLLRNRKYTDQAIFALEELGPEAKSAVPALLALRRRAGHYSAIDVLGKIGTRQAMQGLESILLRCGSDEAQLVVNALARRGPSAVPILIRALKRKPHQLLVAQALRELGPEAAPAVPALLQIVRRKGLPKHAVLREIAITALVAIGPAGQQEIPDLIKKLSDTAPIYILRSIGPRPEVLLALEAKIRNPKFQDAYTAASLLQSFGTDAHDSVPALLNMQKSSEFDVRRNAALALAGIAPELASIEVLLEHPGLRTGNGPSSEPAIKALALLGTRSVPALASLIGEHYGRWRLQAARALAQIGGPVEAARPALDSALSSGWWELAEAAAAALVIAGAEVKGSLATVINDQAINWHFIRESELGTEFWDPESCRGPQLAYDFGFRIPRFPWPPPRFSAHDTLPRPFWGSEGENLTTVNERLAAALEATGFEENGVFEVPGGFALVTRVERIHEDGSPDLTDRWTDSKSVPLDLTDYLGTLFLHRPGQFRLIVFLVTTEDALADTRSAPSEEWARSLYLVGARVLPHKIGELPVASQHCHVLIYHFERRHGAAVVLYPSSLSTREHLRKAGLWAQLSKWKDQFK